MPGFIDVMTYAPKTWGNEIWVINDSKYCGKILSLNKGCHCSYHFHSLKDEVLMVTEGKVLFIYSKLPVASLDTALTSFPKNDQIVLEAGQAWHVTPGIVHQFYGITDAKITEFSTQHFDSDSYRVTKELVGDLGSIS